MKTKKTRTKSSIKSLKQPEIQANVVDVILTDHNYLKECIEVLSDKDANKRTKLSVAKGFLDALQKHSETEDAVLYDGLIHNKEFRDDMLEGKIEHGIADQKVKMLKPKIAKATSLKDELAAELKVLAELIEHHVKEEEKEMLPRIRKKVDKEVLNKMGAQFIKMRKFKPENVEGAPEEWMNSGKNAKRPTPTFTFPSLFPVL